MQFEPNGTITLLSGIPFTSDYLHTRNFSSLNEQFNYFASKPNKAYTATQAVRQDLTYVAIDENIEQLWQYNYMMYQNETMGNKWFYAFIDRLEMKAASCTFMYFHIDVMQTWMFDVSIKECFIERRHPGIESIGTKYYAPESVYYGENYEVVNDTIVDVVRDTTDSSCVLLISNVDLSADFGSYEEPKIVGAEGGVVHHMPTACNYYVVAPDKWGDASIRDVFDLIRTYPWVSKGIIGMTILPNYAVDGVQVQEIGIGGSGFIIGQLVGDSAPRVATVFNRNVFDSFAPVKNKKLLMYPYAFVEISCQNGTTLVVKPQYLNGSNMAIQRSSLITFNPEIKYWVGSYEGIGEEYDFSITIKDLPQLPVQDSSYLLSINQQKFLAAGDRIKTGTSAIGSVIGNLLTGNFGGAVGAVTGGVLDVQNSLFKENQSEAQSPTLNGQIGGSGFNYAHEKMGVTIRWKQIPQGYRNIIDDYFTMYGYEWDEVETPDPTRMSRFDFVKTKGCIIYGNAPQEDIQEMIKVYNKGVTFWHDDDIGNFNNNVGVKT